MFEKLNPLRIPCRAITNVGVPEGLYKCCEAAHNAISDGCAHYVEHLYICSENIRIVARASYGCVVRSTSDASSRTDHPTGEYPSAYFLLASTRPPLLRLTLCPPRPQRAGGCGMGVEVVVGGIGDGGRRVRDVWSCRV